MRYPELIEPCKSAIEENRCLGCEALGNVFFRGNKNCELFDKKENKIKMGHDLDEEEYQETLKLFNKNKNHKILNKTENKEEDKNNDNLLTNLK